MPSTPLAFAFSIGQLHLYHHITYLTPAYLLTILHGRFNRRARNQAPPSISSFLTTAHFLCSCNRTNCSQHFNPPVNHHLQVRLIANHHSSRFVFETEPPRLSFVPIHKNRPA